MSSSDKTTFARSSSSGNGSPRDNSFKGVESLQVALGIKVTETLLGMMGLCSESEIDPADASNRPQLVTFAEFVKSAKEIPTHLASSPNRAVLTSKDVDIVEATLCASSYEAAPLYRKFDMNDTSA